LQRARCESSCSVSANEPTALKRNLETPAGRGGPVSSDSDRRLSVCPHFRRTLLTSSCGHRVHFGRTMADNFRTPSALSGGRCAPSRLARRRRRGNARTVGYYAPTAGTGAEEGLGHRGGVERRAGGWSSDPMIEADVQARRCCRYILAWCARPTGDRYVRTTDAPAQRIKGAK
jgi:hypothetical protein